MKYISIGLVLFWTFSVLTVNVNISVPMTGKSSTVELNKPEFDGNGNLTESGIIELLTKAYQNPIQDIFFEDSPNLKIAQFAKTAGNLPIFKISNITESLGKQVFDKQFVVKEVPSAEYENLLRIYTVKKLQDLIFLGQASNLYPELIVPIYAITYDYNQKSHFVVVMLLSPGNELAKFMLDYLENHTLANLKIVNKAFESVGITLANFQKYLGDDASNYIHGDFHNKNIFIEPNSGSNIDKVYWIDIERMTDYRYPPKTHLVDIIYLLSTLNLVLRGQQLNKWNNASDDLKKIFIKNAAQALISGYILTRYDKEGDRIKLHIEIYGRLLDDLKHDKNPSGIWGFTTFLKKYKDEIEEALYEVEVEISQGKQIN